MRAPTPPGPFDITALRKKTPRQTSVRPLRVRCVDRDARSRRRVFSVEDSRRPEHIAVRMMLSREARQRGGGTPNNSHHGFHHYAVSAFSEQSGATRKRREMSPSGVLFASQVRNTGHSSVREYAVWSLPSVRADGSLCTAGRVRGELRQTLSRSDRPRALSNADVRPFPPFADELAIRLPRAEARRRSGTLPVAREHIIARESW